MRRITGLDWLRVIAASLIVAFHILPYQGATAAILFKWTVPFFFALSGLLDYRKGFLQDFKWLKRKIARIGIPYLFWVSFQIIDVEAISAASIARLYLLCSPTSVMWFLWALLIVITVSWLALRAMSPLMLLVISFILGLLYAFACNSWALLGPVGQWLHQNPGYALQNPLQWLWIYAAGSFIASNLSILRDSKFLLGGSVLSLAVTGITITALTAAQPLSLGYSWGFAIFGHASLGLSALLLGISIPLNRAALIEGLSKVSLGVYVLHPAFIRMFKITTQHLNFTLEPLSFFALVLVLSFGSAWLGAKIPYIRRILL